MAEDQKTEEPKETQADLAGYPNVEALVEGYRNSSREAQRWRQTAEQLQGYGSAPRPEIPQRTRPEDRLADVGVPVDAIDQLVAERIQAAFAPLARGLEARSRILSRHPDYNEYEAKVAQFLSDTPEVAEVYGRLFGADAAGAMDYALLKYGEAEKRRHAPEKSKREPAAATEAQLPSSRSGDARRAEPVDAMVEDAHRRWRETGNKAAGMDYVRARLRQAIKHPDFGEG